MVHPRHGHLSKTVILSVHLSLWGDDDEEFPLTSIEDTWTCNVLFRKVISTIDIYFLVIRHSTVSVSRVIALGESHFIEVLFIDNGHILAMYCQINITINEQILQHVHISERRLLVQTNCKIARPGLNPAKCFTCCKGLYPWAASRCICPW